MILQLKDNVNNRHSLQPIDCQDLQTLNGGFLPFVVGFIAAYGLLSLTFSDDAHDGINDSNGNCEPCN